VPFQYFIEEAFQLQVRHQFYSNNHNTLGVGNHETKRREKKGIILVRHLQKTKRREKKGIRITIPLVRRLQQNKKEKKKIKIINPLFCP
jgi:hypothetical protein